jgi:methylated-DNA-protein-cysteine methyltransferase-like protein
LFPDRGDAHFNERVYALVRLIPPGKVLTYGRVAALLEVPRGARAVGWALSALPNGSDVPWHRVINAQRRVSNRGEPQSERIQLERLIAEDVKISADGQIAADALWDPPLWEIRDLLENLSADT